MEDTNNIFAIKIETKLDGLTQGIHEVEADTARVGGMVQTAQLRSR